MNTERIILECETLFKYFLRKVYGIKLKKVSVSDKKAIVGFFEKISCGDPMLRMSIGRKFLFRYTVFQFDYWRQLDIEKYQNGIPASWIFGDKSVERWIGRNHDFDWTLSRKDFLRDLNVSMEDIFGIESMSKSRRKNETEEKEKLRFPDIPESRFANCVLKTTLYKPTSRTCRKCPMSKQCKTVLKGMYPILYNERT